MDAMKYVRLSILADIAALKSHQPAGAFPRPLQKLPAFKIILIRLHLTFMSAESYTVASDGMGHPAAPQCT
jgi:hypothetical protein